ncbi:uncharacterized protein LOC105251157 isoform X2 [Camponotus floridanus]|uniref:uncharacterized protein LOC105251157 isoform X2 n=1 Tax=Camponotus floridanus TaxID=104421 RepID=UPI000DC6A156|nr:uncharacterized protein LOC105251157 isoform X2 [Camponotus floridanus]
MKEIYLVAILYVATLSVALNISSVTDFPTECPAESQDKIIYLPYENDCTKFYSCYMGIKGEPQDCPFRDNKGNRLHFNPVLQVCDWPRSAGCKLSKPTSASITPKSPPTSSSSSSSSPPTVSSNSPISPTSSSNPPTTTSSSSSSTLPTSSSSSLPTTTSSSSPTSSSLPSTISSDSPTSPTSNPFPSTTSASSSPILPSSSSLPPTTTLSSSSTSSISSSTSSPETTTSNSPTSLTSPTTPSSPTSSSNPSTTTTSSSSPTSSSPPLTTSSDSSTSPTSSSSPFPPTTLSSNSPASSTSPSSSPLTSSSSTPILPSSSSFPSITTSSSSSLTSSSSSPIPTTTSSSPTSLTSNSPTTPSSSTLSTSSSNPSTTTTSSSSPALPSSSPSTISSSSSPILPTSSSSLFPTMPSLPSSSISSTSTTISTAISATTTEISEKPRMQCPSESSTETVRIAHQCLCNVYYECINGDKIRQTCPIGMHFDYEREVCDWPEAANCVHSISTQNFLIDRYENKCYQEGKAFQHEIDCSSYYLCVEGNKILKHCMAGLHFNVTLQMCDYPTKASCDFIVTFLPAANPASCSSSNSTEKVLLPHECNCAQYYECINGNLLLQDCPNGLDFDRIRNTCSQPNDAKCPYVCPCASSTKKVLLPHECNCGQYYECVRGQPALRNCPNNLHFDYIEKICKSSNEATCATSTKPTTTSTDSTVTDTTITGSTVTDTTITGSTVTDTTITDSTVTDTTITGSTVTDTTITGSTVTDTTITGSTVTPTGGPETPRQKCPPKGSTEKARIAHPWVCYLYYECVNGNKEERMCPIGKHFDYIQEVCDWPWKVNCMRPIPTHDMSIDDCHNKCSPEGRTFRHETDCSLYYLCSNGKKILQQCTAGLHFNITLQICNYPYKSCDLPDNTYSTITQNVCPSNSTEKIRFPHNCKCTYYHECVNGKKILHKCPEGLHFDIVQKTCNDPYKSGCAPTFPKSTPMPIISTTKWSKEPDKTTTENPLDPSKCIGTCPEIDPPKVVLLPNEDCKKFCMCSNGIAWVQPCPEPLYFDSKDTVCKNKRDAVCGKRLFNQDRVSMHHRMFNENSLQSPKKENNDDQGIHDNSLSKHIYNFDDKTTTDKTTTENPLDPSKCIGTCPEIDPPKAVLLPNEDCKKFCMCSNGIAWVQPCPEPLYFDSKDTVCKNKRDAVCGKRLFNQDRVSMHYRMFDEKNSLQSLNKENNDDHGIHDNSLSKHIYNFDDKTTTENPLDPSKCIGTCPEIDPPKAVLLPNEDCKKFCMCSNGIAWVQPCPEPLYFDSKDTVCKNKRDAVCGKRLFNQDRVSMHYRMFDEKNSLQSLNKENNDDHGIHDNSLSKHIYNFDDKTTTDKTTTENPLDPSKCIGTCPEIDPPKAVLLPNEDCKKFCMCSNGIAWVQPCPEPLYFDSKDTVCKNKRDAVCGKRLFNQDRVSMHYRMFDEKNSLQSLNKENNDDHGIHDNSLSKHIYNFDDKTTTENPLDPSKCIGTCPEIDPPKAVLLPNEDCKKFCMCSNGIAWVQPCPEPLYFDSKDTVCKNKRDAVCGKRLFNQDRVSMYHRIFDEKNSLQTLKKENNDDQGIHDNFLSKHIYNFDDKTTTENPLDPSKCIGTCPEEDPDYAVLLPNEDCKKFCMCSNGIAWVQPCPEPLYFDSKDKVCKNKRDAVCGKRSFN